MYDRILFPTDGGEAASSVLDFVVEVASAHDATVRVLHVADTTRDSVTRVGGEVVDALEREGERIVEETAARAEDRGVPVVTEVVQGVPHEVIVEYGKAHDVDLVAMPTHGRSGMERLLLGSVTERVVEAAPVPVLTIPPDSSDGFTYPPREVLAATDGSAAATRAVRVTADLAGATGATFHLLHVVETASLGVDVGSGVNDDAREERANDLIEAAVGTAEAASVESVTSSIARGRPYREILDYVEENDVDLVGIGTHGETGLDRYLLGSVSSKLIRTSPVPVLSVRGAEEGDGDAGNE